jgi:hypothetical protein
MASTYRAVWSKGFGFGLSCFCALKYASSRGRGNVAIPKGFPKSVGRVESRLLGFPCFPYSVISMACFGKAHPEITVGAMGRFREQGPSVRDRDNSSRTRSWLAPQRSFPGLAFPFLPEARVYAKGTGCNASERVSRYARTSRFGRSHVPSTLDRTIIEM